MAVEYLTCFFAALSLISAVSLAISAAFSAISAAFSSISAAFSSLSPLSSWVAPSKRARRSARISAGWPLCIAC
ncbi:hypothetical protein BC830DRAFT_1129453 [Chytriomyces sp. MP71]|nr:hypothetical protein BC830DRAFT_1129453 [Chytriomyces sp. MP71]